MLWVDETVDLMVVYLVVHSAVCVVALMDGMTVVMRDATTAVRMVAR